MRSRNIEKRLSQLESIMTPPGATCIVRLENGEEKEVPVREYVSNTKSMKFVKMAKCTLANLEEVDAVLEAFRSEVWKYE